MSQPPDTQPDQSRMLLRCVPCEGLFQVSTGEAGLAAKCPHCGVLLALPKQWHAEVQAAPPVPVASAAVPPRAEAARPSPSGPRKVQEVPVRAEAPKNLAAKIAGQEFAPLRVPGETFVIPPSRAKTEYQAPTLVVPNTNIVKAPVHEDGEGPRLEHRDRIAATTDARFAPDPNAPRISRPNPVAGGRGRSQNHVGWDEEEASSEAQPVPVSPFRRYLRIAGIAALALLVATLLFRVIQDAGGPRQVSDGPVMEKRSSSVPVETGESRELMAKLENEILPLARAFLEAPTITERLALAREPERVRPLMEKYDAEHGTSGPIPYRKLGTIGEVSRAGRFFLVPVILDDYSERKLAIEDTEKKLLADWESFVIYSDMTFRRFAETRPQEALTFRVRVEHADYFNYGFTEEKYYCFLLREPGTDEILYGYTPRDAPENAPGARLRAHVPKYASQPPFATLRLAFPADSKSENQVLIEDFLLKGWVFRVEDSENPKDPTAKGSPSGRDESGFLPVPVESSPEKAAPAQP